MRMLRIVALVAWPVSWYRIWKEIFVWRHMTKSLRFQVPDLPPGVTVTPRPGLPVIGLRAVAVASPIVCVLGFAVEARRNSSGGNSAATTAMRVTLVRLGARWNSVECQKKPNTAGDEQEFQVSVE